MNAPSTTEAVTVTARTLTALLRPTTDSIRTLWLVQHEDGATEVAAERTDGSWLLADGDDLPDTSVPLRSAEWARDLVDAERDRLGPSAKGATVYAAAAREGTAELAADRRREDVTRPPQPARIPMPRVPVDTTPARHEPSHADLRRLDDLDPEQLAELLDLLDHWQVIRELQRRIRWAS